MESLEEQAGNDRLFIADLEGVVKKFGKLQTIDLQLSTLVKELCALTKDLNVARCEKSSLTIRQV